LPGGDFQGATDVKHTRIGVKRHHNGIVPRDDATPKDFCAFALAGPTENFGWSITGRAARFVTPASSASTMPAQAGIQSRLLLMSGNGNVSTRPCARFRSSCLRAGRPARRAA
jgi:hypothetical protein